MKKMSWMLGMLLALGGLPGCTVGGMAVGTGAATGIAAAREGGIKGAVDDVRIRAAINDLWFKYDLETFSKLRLTINQGRVLITGVVQDPEDRVEAVRRAWQVEGVRQVINEIKVADSAGVAGYMRDAWITARLRTAMTFDKNVQSINYSIDTVQGIIYLMGVAQDQEELDRVMQIARTIPDVEQVISYVKKRGEAVPSAGATPLSTDSAGTGALAMPAPAGDTTDFAPAMPAPSVGAVKAEPLR